MAGGYPNSLGLPGKDIYGSMTEQVMHAMKRSSGIREAALQGQEPWTDDCFTSE